VYLHLDGEAVPEKVRSRRLRNRDFRGIVGCGIETA
jgi:hypothetical protein